eukprot:gene6706-10871_t
MGITGKPEKLINIQNTKNDKIPIIKRYTGGGTVFVDENTYFSSFIGETNLLGDKKPFPKDIMKWSEEFYKLVFRHDKFSLREDDFTFDNLKFGGNAQYITGGKLSKFVHHTSFLYKMDMDKIMKYLLIPERKPIYRGEKHHDEFLTNINKSLGFEKMEDITKNIQESAMKIFDSNVEVFTLDDIKDHQKFFELEKYSTIKIPLN